MKYKVLRDNYGFLGRYWKAGSIVVIQDDLKPPHHFMPLKTNQQVSVSNKEEKSKE